MRIVMRKILIFTLFAISVLTLQAQQTTVSVSEGDVFTIQDPSGPDFSHIHFPKRNFIIKRGAVPDMKKMYGAKVVVTAVDIQKQGATRVRLERQDGGKFFRHWRTVEASIDQALASGELKR